MELNVGVRGLSCCDGAKWGEDGPRILLTGAEVPPFRGDSVAEALWEFVLVADPCEGTWIAMADILIVTMKFIFLFNTTSFLDLIGRSLIVRD